jgi:DNA-binding protein H-NS
MIPSNTSEASSSLPTTIDFDNLPPHHLTEIAAQAKKALENRRTNQLIAVQKVIQDHKFSPEEVFPPRIRPRPRQKAAPSAPRFFNPMNPEQTWTGKGRRPDWLLTALAAGYSEESLLIPPDTASPST